MNILSLDLDIFFPCHKYHDIQKIKNLSVDEFWKIVDTLNINYEPDYDKIYKVLDMIKCVEVNNINIITEHVEILDMLKSYKDVDLWNIDFHHDMGYSIIRSKPNSENWVLHAKFDKLINSYTWIRTELSEPVYDVAFNFEQYNILDDFEYPTFDKAVICISPKYTPKKYWDIYKIFVKGVENNVCT